MKLLIVTDINSFPDEKDCIFSKLGNSGQIVRVTLNELCGQPKLSGDSLHWFLTENNGFDEAAKKLSRLANEEFVVLGFSAGGTAIWKAVSIGLKLRAVYCVSSTRLRNEASISIPNHVFFGADDPNIPSASWLSAVPYRATVFDGAGHNFYLDWASKAMVKIIEEINKRMVWMAPTPRRLMRHSAVVMTASIGATKCRLSRLG